MLNINNPAYKLAEKNVPLIAKDIVENGTLGTAGQRLFEATAKAVLKETYLFNQMGRQLRGSGSRLNKLKYTTRRGWRAKDQSQKGWMEFGNHQTASFLSENLKVDQMLETSFGWNKSDIRDLEGADGQALVNVIMSALTEELPIEFEKRVLNGLRDASINGVDWANDDGIVGNAKPLTVAVKYSTDAETLETIDAMIKLSNKMGKIENPAIYRPGKNKFQFLINTELAAAIQKAGGFESFTGDAAFERMLNNQPTKSLNQIPVVISNELGEDQPFYLIPRPGAFNNIEFIFTTLPTKFDTRTDYEGTSASEMFFKSETDEFAINFSYWATKFGLWAAGVIDTGSAAAGLGAHILSSDYNNGNTSFRYSIEATGAYEVVVMDHNFTEVHTEAAIVDGTEQGFTLDDLATGSYTISVRDDQGFPVITSATFYVRNANYDEGTTGDYTNKIVRKSSKKTSKIEKEIVKAEEAAAKADALRAEAEAKAEEAKAKLEIK